jgi:phosphatidylglycerophosphatase A
VAIRNTLLLIATFFNIGKFPKAPGTVATLATIPLWWALWHAGPIIYMIVTLILFPIGIMAAQAYEAQSATHDAKEIVIDEVVGFLITMTWLPMTWQSVVLGFVIFRFLDIVKPPPIRQFDRKVPGGLGVMLDDVAAGIIGSILMQLIYTQTNWLGTQITVLTPN